MDPEEARIVGFSPWGDPLFVVASAFGGAEMSAMAPDEVG